MSDIRLTPELLEALQGVIEDHEPEAAENDAITVQYLAAIAALITARFPTTAGEKGEILDQIHGLMRHVLEQQLQREAAPAANSSVPEGRTEETGPATGVWRPH